MAQRRMNPFRKRPNTRMGSHQIAVPAVEESIKQLITKIDGWQAKILKYSDIVPEVLNGWAFVHNVMDRVELELQVWDRSENAWKKDTTPEAQGIERRINHGFRMGRAAGLMHLVEEAYILVTRVDGILAFETLAPTEIRSKEKYSEKRVMKDGDKHDWVRIDGDVAIIRAYRPDPIDRFKAGGPHKAMLGLLETMALEMLRSQAESVNVLAGNGILFIPVELMPEEGSDLDELDTPGTQRYFENRLEDGMLSTITDRSKGEAVVPLTIWGQAEYGKDIRHITLNGDSAYESGKRMQDLIERYARDVDLPAQIILGMGDSNHWSDWKVDENTWAYHLEPRAQLLADAIYAGVARPILLNLGREPSEQRLAPNAARAIAKQDMSSTAGDAYERGAIRPEAYVEAIGMDPSDMRPDAEELQLDLVAGARSGQNGKSPINQGQPDRAAAGTSPMTVMRHMARIANAHQTKLTKLYQRTLNQIAVEAARSGEATRKAEGDGKTAAGRVDFIGYDPAAYFAKYRDEIETGTSDELFALLRRVATLVGMDYSHLKAIWSTEFTHRAQAVAKEAETAAKTISDRSFKSGKPVRIPPATVRTLTTAASGGSTQSNGKAGNTKRPQHAGEDTIIKDALTYAVGSFATQYTWKVGHPDRPFHPHQDLAGLTWFSWDELEALDSTKDAAWLPGSAYFPGDHDGCQCDYEINFVPREAP